MRNYDLGLSGVPAALVAYTAGPETRQFLRQPVDVNLININNLCFI